MTDLEFIARNMDEWPEEFSEFYAGSMDNSVAFCNLRLPSHYSKSQWQSERERLGLDKKENDVSEVVMKTENSGDEHKQWRGPKDGLPPVGSIVELSKGDGCYTPKHGREGEEVVILCHTRAPNGKQVAVYCSEDTRNNPASGLGVAFVFSPARTKEEKAVEEMLAIKKAHHWTDEEFVRALYKAGWRKGE